MGLLRVTFFYYRGNIDNLGVFVVALLVLSLICWFIGLIIETLNTPDKHEFGDVKPKTLSSGIVDWRNKDGVWLFQQDFVNGELYVNPYIWAVLEKDFGLSRNEIEELLTNLLYDHTNNGKLKIV